MLNLGYPEGLPSDAFQMPNLVTPHSWSPPPPITFLRQVNFSFLSPHFLWHGFNTINLGPRFSRSVSKNKLNNFIVHSGKQGRKEGRNGKDANYSRLHGKYIHILEKDRKERSVILLNMPGTATTETTTTTKTTLIAYLEAEKTAAAARMRQVLSLLVLLCLSRTSLSLLTMGMGLFKHECPVIL